MKYLIIALAATILSLTACNFPNGLNKQKKAPELEMIFGKEKKELESYIGFIDSIQTSTNLPVDTTLFHKGSYILVDSLGELIHAGSTAEIIAMVKAAEAEEAAAKAGELIQVKSINDLQRVLDGKVKYESYETFLAALKKINYLVVIKKVILTEPKMWSNKKFGGGMIISQVQVIDIQKKMIVKTSALIAESSTSVEVSSASGLSQLIIEQDFWKNYHTNRTELLDNLFN